MSYAELNVTSNFTLLTGASHPEEYIAQAASKGLSAIAITDTNTFAGIVRAHAEARDHDIQYIVGVRLVLEDGQSLLAYPKTRTAYGRLCRLLSAGKLKTTKGQCQLEFKDILNWAEGSFLIALDLESQKTKQLAEYFP